jgi:ABC-type sugar transport system, periplasmic component
MNFKKLSSFITIAILSLTGFKAYSADVHGVFCGSELRPNYVEIADEYMKNNPGVNVTLEAVPWGTCQDKVINLAIAGDPSCIFNM